MYAVGFESMLSGDINQTKMLTLDDIIAARAKLSSET